MEVTCLNFSVGEDMRNYKITMIKERISTYLLTLLVKGLRISVEQGRVVKAVKI